LTTWHCILSAELTIPLGNDEESKDKKYNKFSVPVETSREKNETG